MRVLTRKELEEYNERGYLLVKNVISKESLRKVFDAHISIYNKYSSEKYEFDGRFPSWEDPTFHQKLTNLRRNFKSKFGLMYNTINLSVALQKFFSQDVLVNISAQLLSTTVEGLCNTGNMLRMDPPYDDRNSLDWHQDSSYYLQNSNGCNGLVCWVPLAKVTKSNGGVVLCEGSHKEGKVEVSAKKIDHFTSEQKVVPQKIVSKYKQIFFEADAGDAGFFHMDLIHKSGENVSDRIRFVGGVRYHNLLSDDFNPGYLKYHLI